MIADTQTQAILLLTANLGGRVATSSNGSRPLTVADWGRFAEWLHARGRSPADLIEADHAEDVLEGWSDDKISLERLRGLLDRHGALGLALERWERAGLWILTRSHAQYPKKLKQRLGQSSPPVLFGCGDPSLLNMPQIAVVGSRDASPADLAFAGALGERITQGGYMVISGGARGVDLAAMRSCIESGGRAVGILADSLVRTVTSTDYRRVVQDRLCTLVTPYDPEAPFTAGLAMGRNKYLYCCADAAVVVASAKKEGGTWSGAKEAIKAGWTSVWVRRTPASPPGNAALIELGGNDLGERLPDPIELVGAVRADTATPATLFDRLSPTGAEPPTATDALTDPAFGPRNETKPGTDPAPAVASDIIVPFPSLTHFDLFLMKIAEIARAHPASADAIGSAQSEVKPQVRKWLQQAVQRGLLEKSGRPVRYRLTPPGRAYLRECAARWRREAEHQAQMFALPSDRS